MRNWNHVLLWKMVDRIPELSESDLKTKQKTFEIECENYYLVIAK